MTEIAKRLLLTAALFSLPSLALAVPASLTQAGICGFPWVGAEDTTIEIIADVPESIPVAPPAEPSVFEVTVDVDGGLRGWLRLFGASTLEGEMALSAALPGATTDVMLAIPPTPIPSSGPMTFIASGSGLQEFMDRNYVSDVELRINEYDFALTARKDDGQILSGSMGQMDVSCAPNPGENRVLHVIGSNTGYYMSLETVYNWRVPLNFSSTRTATVRTRLNHPTAIDRITFSGPQASSYAYTTDCTVVAPDQPCEIEVIATPTNTLGEHNAVLEVTMADAEATTLTKNLTVTAVAETFPELSIQPDDLVFADTPLGMTVEKRFDVGNGGARPNEGTGDITVTLSGDNADAFYQSNNCTDIPGTGYPGDCIVFVGFQPTHAGAHTALLTISAAHPSVESVQIPVSGTGTQGGTYPLQFSGQALPWPELTANISPDTDQFQGELRTLRLNRSADLSWTYHIWFDMEFVMIGPVTGTLNAEDGMIAEVDAILKINDGKYGTQNPLNGARNTLSTFGGGTCQAVEPVRLTIASINDETAFSPVRGGAVTITSTTLPRFEGCGFYYNSLLNNHVAGGNAGTRKTYKLPREQ